MLPCPLCSKSFKTRQQLNQHLPSHTNERPHQCPFCLAAFRLLHTMQNHRKVVHEGVRAPAEKKWKCSTCSYKGTSKQKLEQHKRKHSTDRPFSCTIVGCGFTSKYMASLAPHVRRVHTLERPYECPSTGCNYKSATKGNLQLHLAVHTNETPFVCQFPGCNRAWKTKFKLSFHIRSVHSAEKPFKCSKCDFRTKYKYMLRQHEDKHANIKRFRCQATNCDFSTTTTQMLRLHFDGNHTIKSVKCRRSGCNYICGTIEILNKHTKIAHVRPIFKCPAAQCIFSSRDAKTLRIHVHSQHSELRSELVSGQLKFQAAGPVGTLMCSFPKCDYQTEFQHRYNRHIKTHDKEKQKYECKLCSQRRSTPAGLALHIQTHTGERPYKCSRCGYTAVSNVLIQRHARSIHGIHVTSQSRGRAHVGKTCRICNEHYGSYCEFVLHSMSHLQAVVILERLNLHVM